MITNNLLRGGVGASGLAIPSRLPADPPVVANASTSPASRKSTKNTGQEIELLGVQSLANIPQNQRGEPKGIAAELSVYVNNLAERVYGLVLHTVMERIEGRDEFTDIEALGMTQEEIESFPGYEERQQTRKNYAVILNDLRQFYPSNDPNPQSPLKLYGSNKTYAPLVSVMCKRPRFMAEMAILIFRLRHAATLDDLLNLMKEATEGLGSTTKVFTAVFHRTAMIPAVSYQLTPEVFGPYHDLAEARIAEVLKQRVDVSGSSAAAQPPEVNKVTVPANSNGTEHIPQRYPKPEGKLLTDEEFLFKYAKGGYLLAFEEGFHCDKDGQMFELNEPATALVERRSDSRGDRLILHSASTRELAEIFAAHGAKIIGKPAADGSVAVYYDSFTSRGQWTFLKPLNGGCNLAYKRLRLEQKDPEANSKKNKS